MGTLSSFPIIISFLQILRSNPRGFNNKIILERRTCPKSVLDCGSGIKESEIWNKILIDSMVVMTSNSHRECPG